MTAKHARNCPFFSVIMPLYGVAEYLPTSLAFILAQTFEDFELICVDDASADGSAGIAERAAAEDARVRVVYHAENQGLAAARNTGLAYARGRYVWMCDGDDEYDLTLLEQVHNALLAVDGGADVCLFGLEERYFDAEGDYLYSNEIVPAAGVYDAPEQWHGKVASFERDTLLGYAWNKVFARELLEGLEFENVRLIEDILFSCDALEHAESLACVALPLYRYRKQEGRSLTNANAYSAREFWSVHERRVARVCGLLDGWGALNADARATMGSLYVRYIVSFLARTYDDEEPWTHRSRLAWLDGVFGSQLFALLVPGAAAQSSPALKLAVAAASAQNKEALIFIGRSASFAHGHALRFFTRTRSGR